MGSYAPDIWVALESNEVAVPIAPITPVAEEETADTVLSLFTIIVSPLEIAPDAVKVKLF
jgi:hypothetical protein